MGSCFNQALTNIYFHNWNSTSYSQVHLGRANILTFHIYPLPDTANEVFLFIMHPYLGYAAVASLFGPLKPRIRRKQAMTDPKQQSLKLCFCRTEAECHRKHRHDGTPKEMIQLNPQTITR